ncbi:uncharacterized protein LOC127264023 isoform X1 [Andrographis paniculata]|uniref:uncharacterized protein LOC127264023 isoform X1 n=1 Tax=Andrographis paniculata TaxID=175694 RepID=UPI0021E81A4D|nr:uncharacterized protein LOC127264023 isoform X1 [Andrographis paniculata]
MINRISFLCGGVTRSSGSYLGVATRSAFEICNRRRVAVCTQPWRGDECEFLNVCPPPTLVLNGGFDDDDDDEFGVPFGLGWIRQYVSHILARQPGWHRGIQFLGCNRYTEIPLRLFGNEEASSRDAKFVANSGDSFANRQTKRSGGMFYG